MQTTGMKKILTAGLAPGAHWGFEPRPSVKRYVVSNSLAKDEGQMCKSLEPPF